MIGETTRDYIHRLNMDNDERHRQREHELSVVSEEASEKFRQLWSDDSLSPQERMNKMALLDQQTKERIARIFEAYKMEIINPVKFRELWDQDHPELRVPQKVSRWSAFISYFGSKLHL